MYLSSVSLQQFRSYKKVTYAFHPKTTLIIGPNAAGKSNIIEAIALLATGKSFRTAKDSQLISFGQITAQVTGTRIDGEDTQTVSVILAQHPSGLVSKKYLVNGVPKRRKQFAEQFGIVLFTPLDLDIVSGQPGERRRFLNDVLEQTDPDYQAAMTVYTKALRQRNALLESVRETGARDSARFAYWDDVLITNGQLISQRRESFIQYINSQEKTLFPFFLTYDKSEISKERLMQYQHAEVGAGVTLVGPQRDDVFIQTFHPVAQEFEDVKYFCSRGQQRLITLELKKSQISYIAEQMNSMPVLLLDDIFSELDQQHILHVLQMARPYQTILTTTHTEFIPDTYRKSAAVIELGGKE